ncbi:MAG TPA: hypothetical protein VGK56_07900, partial [Anaerolineales bacterium]
DPSVREGVHEPAEEAGEAIICMHAWYVRGTGEAHVSSWAAPGSGSGGGTPAAPDAQRQGKGWRVVSSWTGSFAVGTSILPDSSHTGARHIPTVGRRAGDVNPLARGGHLPGRGWRGEAAGALSTAGEGRHAWRGWSPTRDSRPWRPTKATPPDGRA